MLSKCNIIIEHFEESMGEIPSLVRSRKSRNAQFDVVHLETGIWKF